MVVLIFLIGNDVMIDKDQPEIETKTLKTIKLPLYDNIIKNIKFIALMQKFLGFL